jgi:cation:H+ antiporter
MDVVLLFASFAVILAGAQLFTNAVEWSGHRLSMGEGAVGSLIAAVGTAMPETLIPVIAVIGGAEGAEDVAIGAIIGAPFLLATIAMTLVGLTAIVYRRRRPQGVELDAHKPTLERDLVFFLVFFTLGCGIGAIDPPSGVKYAMAAVLLGAYAVYVVRTLRGGGDVQAEDTLAPLVFARPRGVRSRPDDPAGRVIVFQLVLSLATIVGGAHLFVEELIHVADRIGVAPIVLSLVLAPLATELPEKANSFFWVRDGKDSLALGNITGAMVFQSTIPVAFGLAFTEWDLDDYSILSAALGVAGGVVAYVALHRRGRYNLAAILCWGTLYVAFLAYVLAA